MRGFVGNTDFDWFTFLAARQPLEEVNFWQPSGGDAFRALAPGEPFFFRLKKPHYAIGGFGLFARHEVVSAKLAWEAFGERNGAPDFAAMCARIQRYRRGQPPDPVKQYRVGCLMISQPVFFAEADWVREPADFSRNVVRGVRAVCAGPTPARQGPQRHPLRGGRRRGVRREVAEGRELRRRVTRTRAPSSKRQCQRSRLESILLMRGGGARGALRSTPLPDKL